MWSSFSQAVPLQVELLQSLENVYSHSSAAVSNQSVMSVYMLLPWKILFYCGWMFWWVQCGFSSTCQLTTVMQQFQTFKLHLTCVSTISDRRADCKTLAWATTFVTGASRKCSDLPKYRASRGKKRLLSYPGRQLIFFLTPSLPWRLHQDNQCAKTAQPFHNIHPSSSYWATGNVIDI